MRTRQVTRPYLVVPDSMVTLSPPHGWELQREGAEPENVDDKGILAAWDTELRFTLRRKFNVTGDIHGVLGLDATREIRLVTRLGTARGLDSRIVHEEIITPSESSVLVEICPDGRTLASEVSLTTALVLGQGASTENPLAPQDAGDRVWETGWSARIEGGRARLPLEPITFSGTWHAHGISHALFHVEVADFPELEFEQAVCVYLNTDFPEFVRAIEASSAPETAILWDGVLRRTIASGLASHFESATPWPDGSLGLQVDTWLNGIFPGVGREAVSRIRIEDPSRFEAQIQSWARIASNTGLASA